VVTLSSLAFAADQEPIDLVYRTHEGCPSERQFIEMVVGRAAKTLVLSERARGRKFYVTVTQQRRETVGKLEIVAGGTTASREVSGANCSEVVSALALFTALAIDPSARIDTKPEPRPEEPPPPPEPKPPPKPIAPPEPAQPITIEPDVRPPSRAPSWAISPGVIAGAHGVAEGSFTGGAAAPATSRGGGLFVQWTTPRLGAYRLSGAYFANSETSGAKFQFFAGRLDGCPFEAHLAPSLVVEPCLGLEVGRVTATSQASPALSPTTQRRGWVAGDLLGRARFAPIPWIFAELEAGVSMPFTRYTFLLGTPNDVRGQVHKVPPVGWVLGLGLGVRIL
jgi:hypothetical protein